MPLKNEVDREDDGSARLEELPSADGMPAVPVIIKTARWLRLPRLLQTKDPSLTWGSPRLLHCTPIIQMR